MHSTVFGESTSALIQQWLRQRQLITLKIAGEPDTHLSLLLQFDGSGKLLIDAPNIAPPPLDTAIFLMASTQQHRINCLLIEATQGGWQLRLAERRSLTQRRGSPRVGTPLKQGPSLAFKTHSEQVLSCRLIDISSNGFAGELRGDQTHLIGAGERFTNAFLQLDGQTGVKVGVHIVRAKLLKRPTRTHICAELYGLELDGVVALANYVKQLHHAQSHPSRESIGDATLAWGPLSTQSVLPTSPPPLPSPSQGAA